MKLLKLDSRIYHFIKKIRIAVLVLGTAILFYACKNNEIDKIQSFQSPKNLPVLEAINFETLKSDSGQIRFSLKAPKVLRFVDEGKPFHEFPFGMEIIEYDEHKNIISSITADYAKEFIKEGKWEVKNNVVVTNAKGDSLKTEHLIWEIDTKKISTEEFVKIISESRVITGVGMTSDQNMGNWKIKNVKGKVYVDANNTKKKSTPTKKEEKADQPVKKLQPVPQTIKFK